MNVLGAVLMWLLTLVFWILAAMAWMFNDWVQDDGVTPTHATIKTAIVCALALPVASVVVSLKLVSSARRAEPRGR
jgi:hypothetical protein